MRKWEEEDIYGDRAMWIRAYDIPAHACSAGFFEAFVNSLGSFVCLDEKIANETSFEVARFRVCVPLS